jgi:hypothetical protein
MQKKIVTRPLEGIFAASTGCERRYARLPLMASL